jgi:hypothetical protein
MPMLTPFDKQIQVRMGQANVKRWVGDTMPLLMDADPLGAESFPTQFPLAEAPEGLRDVPEEAGRRDQDPAQALAPGGVALWSGRRWPLSGASSTPWSSTRSPPTRRGSPTSTA